jgi:hypothetical protein
MEVGAAVRPNEVWDAVARHSVYVGVGPETTTLSPSLHGSFHRLSLIEDVVTPEACRVATFHETCDRVYSTVLEPNAPETTPYLDGQSWSEHMRLATATTITSLLKRLSLDRLDWLHTNANGIDVELFRSIEQPVRSRILALDTVFDLVHLWTGPGSQVTSYQELVAEGFWLTRLSSHGFVRIQPKSVQQLEVLDRGLSRVHLGDRLRVAPGWMFARFLRTLESLLSVSSSRVDYATLWAFAIVDDQLGYAADVAFQYRRIFGEDEHCKTMVEETVRRIRSRVDRRTKTGSD